MVAPPRDIDAIIHDLQSLSRALDSLRARKADPGAIKVLRKRIDAMLDELSALKKRIDHPVILDR